MAGPIGSPAGIAKNSPGWRGANNGEPNLAQTMAGKRFNSRSQRGFLSGLLENMVAAAVILVGLSFLVSGIPLSNRAAHQAELRCQASDVSLRYISNVRQAPATSYPNGTTQVIKDGDFQGQLLVEAGPSGTNLRDVTVTLQWSYAGTIGQMQRKARVGDVHY
jgi:hypothetical protein